MSQSFILWQMTKDTKKWTGFSQVHKARMKIFGLWLLPYNKCRNGDSFSQNEDYVLGEFPAWIFKNAPGRWTISQFKPVSPQPAKEQERCRKHRRSRAERLHGINCGRSAELGSVSTRNVYIFIKSEIPAKEMPPGTKNEESFLML